jgi:serine/threonine protein kinase
MFSDYQEITRVSANSASGELFFAKRKTDDLEVAIKFNKDLSSSSHDRFLRENDILHDLHDPMAHNNIIEPLTRILTTPGLAGLPAEYYVMKKATTNLAGWLYEDRAKIIENKVNLFEQICIGLKHAHDNGYTHRDLHDENVLIEFNPVDTVKLIDFGRAYDFNKNTWLSSASPAWGWLVMPPEVRFGTVINPDAGTYEKGDIFALGLLWMFLFRTDTDPVDDLQKINLQMYEFMNPYLRIENFQSYYILTSLEQRKEKYNEWLQLFGDSSTSQFDIKLINVARGDKLTKIAQKLLAFDPAKRFETIEDIINELRSI